MEKDCNSVSTTDCIASQIDRAEDGLKLDMNLENNLRSIAGDDELFERCLRDTREDSMNMIRRSVKVEQDNFPELFIHRIAKEITGQAKKKAEQLECCFCLDYIRKYGSMSNSKWANSIMFVSDPDSPSRINSIKRVYENVKSNRVADLEGDAKAKADKEKFEKFREEWFNAAANGK